MDVLDSTRKLGIKGTIHTSNTLYKSDIGHNFPRFESPKCTRVIDHTTVGFMHNDGFGSPSLATVLISAQAHGFFSAAQIPRGAGGSWLVRKMWSEICRVVCEEMAMA